MHLFSHWSLELMLLMKEAFQECRACLMPPPACRLACSLSTTLYWHFLHDPPPRVEKCCFLLPFSLFYIHFLYQDQLDKISQFHPTWHNNWDWSVSQFLQCFYRGLFEAGRWNNIFSFPWILFSLSIPIHREMAALSGENIALMFSPTFHVFNENNSKRNVSCNYIIHSLYPCSIKTREVLINPSPMPKRFPETGENPSFVSRSGNPFLP